MEESLEPLSVSQVIEAPDPDQIFKELSMRSGFEIYDRGLLCRASPLDGVLKIVVPVKLQERCLSLFHLQRIAGHPGSTKMYGQLRRSFEWPIMALDVARHVSSCPSCIKHSLKSKRKTTRIKLFPPNDPKEFISIDILGPLITS